MKVGEFILLRMEDSDLFGWVWWRGHIYKLRKEVYALKEYKLLSIMRYSDPELFLDRYCIKCGIVTEVGIRA